MNNQNVIDLEINDVVNNILNEYNNSGKGITLSFALFSSNIKNAVAMLCNNEYIIGITRGLTYSIHDFIFNQNYLDDDIKYILEKYLPSEDIVHIKNAICVSSILCAIFHEYGHVVNLHLLRSKAKRFEEYISLNNKIIKYTPNNISILESEADIFMGMMLSGLTTQRLDAIGIESNRAEVEEKIMILSIFTLFYVLNNVSVSISNDYPPLVWRVYSAVAMSMHTQKNINDGKNIFVEHRIIDILEYITNDRKNYLYSLIKNCNDNFRREFINIDNDNFNIWVEFYKNYIRNSN